MHKNIDGRTSDQRSAALHLFAILSYRWSRSTKPLLAAGWYAVFLVRVVPNRFLRWRNRSDSNCLSWWIVIRVGVPKLETREKYSACTTVFAYMFCRPTRKSIKSVDTSKVAPDYLWDRQRIKRVSVDMVEPWRGGANSPTGVLPIVARDFGLMTGHESAGPQPAIRFYERPFKSAWHHPNRAIHSSLGEAMNTGWTRLGDMFLY